MSSDRQTDAPILEALRQYHDDETLPFSVPGHRCGRGVDGAALRMFGAAAFRNDVPQLGGFDDRRESKQVRQRAEALAAEAWGSDVTRFSVNGSSLSAHVSVLAVARPGDQIVVARNVHKSMIDAALLAGVDLAFVDAEVDREWDIENGPSPERVARTLAANPRAKGVFIVSPGYYGVTADVAGIANVCHARGVPLVVDEAWGGHLAFHPELPPSAMHAGADLAFASVHKPMSGLTQASVLHLRKGLVAHDSFERAFDLFETTSPSSLVLGSLDAARRQHAVHGRELWGTALELARRARAQISRLPGLRVLGREMVGRPGAASLDETKLALDTLDLNVTGFAASDWLTEHHHLAVEMADYRHLLCFVTLADDDGTIDRLLSALHGLVRWARSEPRQPLPPRPGLHELRAELVMPPRQAFFAEAEEVPLESCEGRIAAESVSPYPPGISRIVPGERITRAAIEYLQRGIEQSMYVQDARDPELRRLRVVRE